MRAIGPDHFVACHFPLGTHPARPSPPSTRARLRSPAPSTSDAVGGAGTARAVPAPPAPAGTAPAPPGLIPPTPIPARRAVTAVDQSATVTPHR